MCWGCLQTYFSALNLQGHELAALQCTLQRSFNWSVYHVPFLPDEDALDLARFGVEKEAVGAAEVASPVALPPVTGYWSVDGDAPPFPGGGNGFEEQDVRAAFGGSWSANTGSLTDPLALGLAVGIDALPGAREVLAKHAAADAAMLSAVYAGVDVGDADSDLFKVLSTAVPTDAPRRAVPVAVDDVDIVVPSTPTPALQSAHSTTSVPGAAANTASLRGIMSEPVDDDFWRSSSSDDSDNDGPRDGEGSERKEALPEPLFRSTESKPRVGVTDGEYSGSDMDDDDDSDAGGDPLVTKPSLRRCVVLLCCIVIVCCSCCSGR